MCKEWGLTVTESLNVALHATCQKHPNSNGGLMRWWLATQPHNEVALSNKLNKEFELKWYHGCGLDV